MNVTFRPIDRWPTAQTVNRKASPFRAHWDDTLDLLEFELGRLRAHTIVIQLAITEDEIRRDGWPRAHAQPSHPGVILAFESIHGPLKYMSRKERRTLYGEREED